MALHYTPADVLSCGKSPKTEQELSIHVNLAKKPMPVSDDMWEQLQMKQTKMKDYTRWKQI